MKIKETTIADKIELIEGSGLGIYVPQSVTESNLNNDIWDWSNVQKEDINTVLDGPENEWYWDAWQNITDQVEITYNGFKYSLINNEDLWAIREDATEEEIENWII